MEHAVVTGPTGVIGMALLGELIKRGVRVTAVLRPGSKRRKNLPENPLVSIVECGLGGLKELAERRVQKADVFYHFGWDGTFGASRNDVQKQLMNIRYTLDAVEAAEKLGCSRFIGAGSQAEYGRTEGKLSAEVPAFPENGYGAAKLCAGQMSRILCGQKGIAHIWPRILSVYGPYDGENTMIMSTIGTLLKGEVPKLTAGEQLWDYLYAKDAGRALYLLGEKGLDQTIYCLGSGKAQRLSECMKSLRDTIDPALPLGIGSLKYAPGQVMYLCADITRLSRDTGFVPEYTFERGIRETVEWYKGRKYE